MELEYFGTNLDSHGHYFWDLSLDSFGRSNRRFHELPFNPEGLPYPKMRKGFWEFYNFARFSILAISGSCKDDRGGTKSIFFIEEMITQEEMIKIIKDSKIAMKMINQMPFEVKNF